MKRLVFSPGFPPNVGGQPSYMYARCLADPQAIEVIALYWEGSEAFDARQPFSVHRFEYFYRSVPWYFAPVRRLIQLIQTAGILHKHLISGEFDILEVGTVYPGAIIAEILFPRRRFRLVAYALGDDILKPQKNWFTRLVFRRVSKGIDMFVAISNYTKDKLIKVGVPRDRIVLIPPPIDQEKFGQPGDPLIIRKRLAPHDLMLLTVCKLSEKKNVGQIIELMPSLLEKFPGLLYVVAGNGPDLPRLRSLAHGLGVEKRVQFLGYISEDELVHLYAAADVFVMVTKEDAVGNSVEGFGIVFLEAGSQGVPVIGPSKGGSTDAIADGISGFLVDPNDPVDIERRIVELLCNPSVRAKMGAEGKKLAFMKPDWSPLDLLISSSNREKSA